MKYKLFYLLLSLLLSHTLLAQDFTTASIRQTWLIQQLEQVNQTLTIADKNNKYCKMQSSAYYFYRGSNHLYWQDWYQHPLFLTFNPENTQIWLQADLHADNFGAYSNSKNQLIYDLNDFDESFIADYQYDLLRMAVSLYLIGSQQAISADKAVNEFLEHYLKQLEKLSHNNKEQQLVFTEKNTKGKLDNFLHKLAKTDHAIARLKMLKKWTKLNKNKQRQFKSPAENKDLMTVTETISTSLKKALQNYSSSTQTGLSINIKDIAKRLNAGTGSLGTERYYVLIEGASFAQDDDRILDIKQQNNVSAWAFFDKAQQQAYQLKYPNNAQRHARAYLALTQNTDIYLGWFNWQANTYSVRERSPYKKTFKISKLKSKKSLKKMARQWGKILATAHARADNDANNSLIDYSFEAQALAQINDKAAFQQQLAQAAKNYAAQVQLDYQVLKNWDKISCEPQH